MRIPSEVINADVGQFYQPLSIGTAKPNWQTDPFTSHLFDIMCEPKDVSVVQFRALVLAAIEQACNSACAPVVTGGSLFYVKSLFFPPVLYQDSLEPKIRTLKLEKLEHDQSLWQELYVVDQKRASQIHPNDIYRIQRALEIWTKTGKKPSEFQPQFAPEWNSLVVIIVPDKHILQERICLRTISMIEDGGWIVEAQKFIDTPWEDFIVQKGLIGYKELFTWIRAGKKQEDLAAVIEAIQINTLQYAKRQKTFLRKFIQDLEQQRASSQFICEIIETDKVDENTVETIINAYKKIRD